MSRDEWKRKQEGDPFWPDWDRAPEWAQYHTVDEDGQGTWWRNADIVLGPDGWYHDAKTPNRYVDDTPRYNLTGLDWQNSLRARPETKAGQP